MRQAPCIRLQERIPHRPRWRQRANRLGATAGLDSCLGADAGHLANPVGEGLLEDGVGNGDDDGPEEVLGEDENGAPDGGFLGREGVLDGDDGLSRSQLVCEERGVWGTTVRFGCLPLGRRG